MRIRSTIITFSAASFTEARSRARSASSAAPPVRGRVPLIGAVVTRSPARCRNSSGLAPTAARSGVTTSAARAGATGSTSRAHASCGSPSSRTSSRVAMLAWKISPRRISVTHRSTAARCASRSGHRVTAIRAVRSGAGRARSAHSCVYRRSAEPVSGCTAPGSSGRPGSGAPPATSASNHQRSPSCRSTSRYQDSTAVGRAPGGAWSRSPNQPPPTAPPVSAPGLAAGPADRGGASSTANGSAPSGAVSTGSVATSAPHDQLPPKATSRGRWASRRTAAATPDGATPSGTGTRCSPVRAGAVEVTGRAC
ncbi:hypothetical protein WY02_14950 [Pseudonocardia sp. AL041005-10]|nr:hypothetical protein WY02_14950 [Pseudonocardia sp. AL041005-10]